MKPRATIFNEDQETLPATPVSETQALDLTGFRPRAVSASQGLGPTPEQIRTVSEASQFKSREPVSKEVKRIGKRPTGRTGHLACKVLPPAVAAFYAIAKHKGWSMGITVEKALKALIQKEEISLEQLKVHLNLNLLGYDPDKKNTWELPKESHNPARL